MQQVIISGTLLSDAWKFKDKNGREFLRFIVTCGHIDQDGHSVFTNYRCTYYAPGYESLKKGDQVFIIGKFFPKLETDDKGKTYMILDVMVSTLTNGFKHNERKAAQKG